MLQKRCLNERRNKTKTYGSIGARKRTDPTKNWVNRQKERFLDKPIKHPTTRLTKEQIDADSKKDLQDNISAVIMALNNLGVPVNQVLPYQGTTAGVFDSGFIKHEKMD